MIEEMFVLHSNSIWEFVLVSSGKSTMVFVKKTSHSNSIWEFVVVSSGKSTMVFVKKISL